MKHLLSKILIGSFCIGTAFSTISCEDSLETKVHGQIEPTSFFNTKADLESAVIGVSIYLAERGAGKCDALWSAHYVSYFMSGLYCTDELQNSFGGDPKRLDRFEWTPAQSGVTNTYNLISTCAQITDLISIFESNTKVDRESINRYIGELKALRAQYMYTLYDFFGPVNVKLDPTTLTDETPMPRLSDEEYCKALLQDINDALASPLEERHSPSSELWGRMSKDVVRMVKLRYHMHQKEWNEAEIVCRELTAVGYELQKNYEDIFNIAGNKEVIFGCPGDTKYGSIWPTEVCPAGYSTQESSAGTMMLGWDYCYMPWDHFHKMYGHEGEPSYDNDTRVKTFMTEFITFSGVTKKESPDLNNPKEVKLNGVIPIKFTDWHKYQFIEFPIEQTVYRLAEVKLSLAETIVRQKGITLEAIDEVADIRERAGLGRELPQDVTSSKEEFLNFLLDERSRELYCEGQRREDLIRFDKFIKRAQEQGKTSAKDYMTLFPIPNDVVLQGNGIITQNSGYPKPE